MSDPQPPDLRDLVAGWERVAAVRDASPPDCECRAATGPLLEAWFGRVTVHLSTDDLARSWSDLRKAQAAQTAARLLPPEENEWILDVRTRGENYDRPRPGVDAIIPIDPVPAHNELGLADRLAEVPRGRRITVFCQSGVRAERAVRLLRANGWEACNGHAETCEVSAGAGHAGDARLGAAGPADILAGLAGGAGAAAGQGAAQGAVDAVRGAVPGIAAAVRAEVPATVKTAADAAKAEAPAVVAAGGAAAQPVAEAAGEAAGRGAVAGAKGEAGGLANLGFGVKLIGAVLAVGALFGIGWAVLGGGKKDDK